MYRALGSIPRLQNVHLGLDASDYSVKGDWGDYDDEGDNEDFEFHGAPNKPHFSEFEQQYYKYYNSRLVGGRYARIGHFRDARINSALDQNLARAIFQTIYAGKTEGSQALEQLSVRIVVARERLFAIGNESGAGFYEVLRRLHREWLVKRNIRDNRRDELIVQDADPTFGNNLRLGENELPPWIEPLFRSVWP